MKQFFFLLVIVSCLSACLNDEDWFYTEGIIKNVKSEFVPDRRVALFEVKATKTDDEILLEGETTVPAAKQALLKRLTESSAFTFVDSIRVLPTAQLQDNHFAVVRLSVANIRSNPKHAAELSTQAIMGTPLRVWKKSGDWFYIQTPDNYLGWIDKDGLTLMNKEAFTQWQQSEKIVITSDKGSMKVVAGTHADADVVSDLVLGNILQKNTEVAVRGSRYTPVQLPDGRTGFVASALLTDYADWIAQPLPDSTAILATAKQLSGYPYLWGGTSSKGMDCSGFTKTVFFVNGLQLPRDASQQVQVGQEVETDTLTFQNLQAGDLLFFGKKATKDSSERITHTGIYIGNGRMIHAAGNVKINSLRRQDADFAEHRLLTFVRAKRMTADPGKHGVLPLRDSKFY